MMDGRNKEFIMMSDFYKSDDMTFEMDSWWPATYKEESKDNTFVIDTFNSVNPDSRLQLRLHGKGYFNDKSARLYGNMMHDLLSAIKTAGDVQPAVNELVFSGAIDLEEGIQMSERILKLISQPDTAQWFSKDANVINETEILVSEGNFLRPDRVVIYDDHVDVIDYKFGNLERKKYIRQVSTYMKLMKEMGYKNINGYLWYVELDRIEKV